MPGAENVNVTTPLPRIPRSEKVATPVAGSAAILVVPSSEPLLAVTVMVRLPAATGFPK
jgi:hypothetical protein